MPLVKVIARAKINKSQPLNLVIEEVLKPIIKQTPKTISSAVEVHPITGIIDDGTIGFNDCVGKKIIPVTPCRNFFTSKTKAVGNCR